MMKAIFLDRDGTMNEDVGYARSMADIHIFPEAPAALKEMKEQGYVLIAITNQAVIARGWLSEEGMRELHQAYNRELVARGGVPLDHFYFCPHHPNADLPAYRKICECRKPAHGLILQAASEQGISLQESWMIGDRITDIVAGKKAGCKTILLVTLKSYEMNVSGITIDAETKPDFEVKSLKEAADVIRLHP